MTVPVQRSQVGMAHDGAAVRDTVPIQRYVQFATYDDEAKNQVAPNFTGLPPVESCRLSDDGTALVTKESHWFYATPKLIKQSIEQLAARHSALTLEPTTQDQVLYTGTLVPNAGPLLRVEPRQSPAYQGETGIHQHKVTKGGPGFGTHGVETVCLAFPNSCRMTARAILMGNPMGATRGVYRTGTGEALTEPHGASPKDIEWPRFPTEIRRGLMTYLLEIASVSTEDRSRITGLQGEALNQELGTLYLGLEEEQQRIFDELAGINLAADAHIGEAWVSVSDVDLLTQEKRESYPTSSPRAHWAAVVAEPGSDRVTLEGTRITSVGGALDPVHTRLWNFGMYGTRKDQPEQLFHRQWRGEHKTSVVVRGTGEVVPEGILDYRAEKERRAREQEAAARRAETERLRSQVTAEMIGEVREQLSGMGTTPSDEAIREVLVQTRLDIFDAVMRLMG
jgi:hypothetical protein